MAITRSLHFLIAGQSYGYTGYQSEGSYYTFCEAVRRAIDDAPATVNATTGLSVAAGDLLQVRNEAVSGSAIVAAHQGSAGYWVENDLTTPGSLLNDATTAIAGYATKPILIVYSHGEQDAAFLTSEIQSQNMKTAINGVLWPGLRTALNAVTPTDVPIWVDMLGPRFDTDESDEYRVRDRFIELLASNTNVFRGAEKYAVQLDDTFHPTPLGYKQLGAHTGRKVEQWLLGGVELRGPQITNPVKVGSAVTVTISVPAGKTLEKPAEPDFFGLFDSGGARLDVLSYNWNGNDLTITTQGAASRLRYPCPTGRTNVDITKIIRLSDPVDPLYSGEPGLVLESMATHTF